MAETKQGMSQNETLMHRAVSVAVAVALAGSMANFGIAAKAYAEETANTNANADNAALVTDNTNANENANENEVSEAALLDDTDNANNTNTNANNTNTTATLTSNMSTAETALKARFVSGGTDEALAPVAKGDAKVDTDYAAYALYHMSSATINTTKMAASWNADDDKSTSISDLSRWILTLTAAGLDASQLSTSTYGTDNGDLITNLETLIKTKTTASMTVEELAWALPVYQNYADSNNYASSMVAALVEKQDEDTGLFGDEGDDDSYTYTATAQAIVALAPYTDEDGDFYDEEDYSEDAADAVTAALAALKAVQNDDGGFPNAPAATATADDDTSTSTVESTAWVISALAAAGKNSTSADYTKGENTPVSYLLDQADTGYGKYTTYQEDTAKEPGVAAMALMAYEAQEGYTTNGGSYDVLEFPVETTKTTTNTNTTKTTTTTSTAKTGDNGLLLGAAGVIAAAAAGTVVFSRRRENSNK